MLSCGRGVELAVRWGWGAVKGGVARRRAAGLRFARKPGNVEGCDDKTATP